MGVSTEPIEGFVGQLTLHVAHQAEPVDAPVPFIDADVPVLLGRESLFDCYRIKFEEDHSTFEIKPAQTRLGHSIGKFLLVARVVPPDLGLVVQDYV
jgi:hypothetical protein